MPMKTVFAGSVALAMFAMPAASATIGHVTTGSQNLAGANLTHLSDSAEVTPLDGADTYDSISAVDFNALSPAELAARFDVIVLPWNITGSANMDWDTRIRPFLNLGGGILWEDPNNIGDIAGPSSGLDLSTSGGYGSNIGPSGTIALDAPFGDEGAEGYYHIHFGIRDHSDDWNCWSVDINGDCHGVNRDFLPGAERGGRMVLGVSDNLYHPSFAGGFEDDHRQLTINQLNWILTGTITGDPVDDEDDGPTPAVVPLPAAGWLMLAALGGVAATRRRKS